MTTADNLSYKAKQIIGSEDGDTSSIRNRAMISGAIVVGLFGMYYGYTKKKNVLVFGAGGAVVGAIAARMFMLKL